ncbi:SMP-30/gluconolactonase/LRE family protein [Sphingobium sp. Sx8-8]|uniref:SMP-30/gluconolactonase/LRE family protein n=1 Tax=Sphingobium sp. Sx8-8 TaxID=2933617 RepID=UPI001F576F1E|nr:SMP-30/gluconolactonase/LRE family protein [Sphingobium sp. Sx8-8]
MTSRRMFLTGLASLPVSTVARAETAAANIGSITRLSPALDGIIAPAASISLLAKGFRWAEGPVWVPRDNGLLFNDPPSNVLYRWRAEGGARPLLSPSGLQGVVPPGIREAGLNGLALDAAGALIAADSGTRAIVRVDPRTGKRTILADRFEGKRFNSPNDLCVAPSGMIYFTDPPYGLTDGDTSSLRELDYSGLYALGPDGKLTLLDRSHRRPNGVAVSPDGRTLYLALSDERQPEVHAYALDAHGLATGQRLFYDMRVHREKGLPGLPDGIKVAPDGHVFATGPGGVHILTAQGQALGLASTGKTVANCCFDLGGRRLFMTSSDMLAVLPLNPAWLSA